MERLQIAIPFAALAIFYYFYGFSSPNIEERVLLDCLIATIFLDLTHLSFSFSSQMAFPETARWRKNWLNKNGIWRLLLLSIFLVGIFALMYSIQSGRIQGNYMGMNAKRFMGFVYSMLLLSHAIFQTLGISLLYNKKLNQSGRWERRGVSALFFLIVFDAVARNFFASELRWFFPFLSPLIFIVCGLVLFSCYWVDRSFSSKKILFSARYLLWAFRDTNPWARSSLRVVHGFEYALLHISMMKNSAAPFEKKRLILIFGSFFILFFLLAFATSDYFMILATNYGLNWRPYSDLIKSVIMTTFIAHIFWDQSFFRLSAPAAEGTSRALLGISPGSLRLDPSAHQGQDLALVLEARVFGFRSKGSEQAIRNAEAD